MREWQFNVLFCVGVGGALFLLIAPAIGLDHVPKNPGAVAGVGTILTYVLTQRRSSITKKKNDRQGNGEPEEDQEEAP